MPTPRKRWPESLARHEVQLIELLDSLYRIFLVGSELKIDLTSHVVPRLDHVLAIIKQIEEIKDQEYETLRITKGERGSWPRWLVNGIKPACRIVEQIKVILTQIEKTPSAFLNAVYEQKYRECARLTARLIAWVKDKVDL